MYAPTIMPPRTLQQLSSFILFYGYLAVLGAAGLSMLLILIYWPQWRVNRSFVEAEGLVVDQRGRSLGRRRFSADTRPLFGERRGRRALERQRDDARDGRGANPGPNPCDGDR